MHVATQHEHHFTGCIRLHVHVQPAETKDVCSCIYAQQHTYEHIKIPCLTPACIPMPQHRCHITTRCALYMTQQQSAAVPSLALPTRSSQHMLHASHGHDQTLAAPFIPFPTAHISCLCLATECNPIACCCMAAAAIAVAAAQPIAGRTGKQHLLGHLNAHRRQRLRLACLCCKDHC